MLYRAYRDVRGRRLPCHGEMVRYRNGAYPTSRRLLPLPAEKVASEKAPWRVRCTCYTIQQAPVDFLLVNIAFALAMRQGAGQRRLRVGLLDLDIFGPSIPKLMGLESVDEPHITDGTSSMFSHHFIVCSETVFTSWRARPTHEPWRALHVHGIPSPPFYT